MINGEMAALRPVLEAMPRERVDACPELSLAFGAAMLAFGKQALAEPHLRGARAAVAACRRNAERSSSLHSAAVGLYEGRFGGDPAAALTTARDWLGRGPVLDGEAVAPNLRGLVLTQLGIVEMWTGQLDEAISISSVRRQCPPRRGWRVDRVRRERAPRRWPACCAASSRAPCAAPTRRSPSPSVVAQHR